MRNLATTSIVLDRKHRVLLTAILLMSVLTLPTQRIAPAYAAPDPAETYIVSSWGRDWLWWVTPDGNTELIYDYAGRGMDASPTDVEIDPAGFYIVAESGIERLSRINPTTHERTEIATFDPGTWPRSVAIVDAGRYVVTGSGNGVLYSVLADGTKGTLVNFRDIVALNARANDVAIDAAGNYIVTISTEPVGANRRIYKIKNDGTNLGHCVVNVADAAPMGIAIDPNGDYIVTDWWNNKLYKVDDARVAAGAPDCNPETLYSFAADTRPWGIAIIPGVLGVPTLVAEEGKNKLSVVRFFAGSYHRDEIKEFASGTTPVSVTFATASKITITSSPVTGAGFVKVSGTDIATPQEFTWAVNSGHRIEALSPVTVAGTEYVFTGWSDGGAQAHDYTTPAADATVTANYTTQHQLTIAFNPPVVDISTSPPGTATITATITPNVAGKAVVLSYRKDPATSWTPIGSGTTDAAGQVSITWTPPETGTYYFRADIADPALTATSDPASLIAIPEFPLWLAPMLLILSLATVTVLLRKVCRRQDSL